MALEYLTVEHISIKQLIRIFARIEIHPEVTWNGTPCWIWCGSRNSIYGHGALERQYYSTTAHKVMFAWLVGPILKGKTHGELDHLCRNPPCCNPVHLEFVSHRINVLRGNGPTAINARKTHCIRGHLLAGDNIYVQPSNPTGRRCQTCRNAANETLKQRPRITLERTHCKRGHALIGDNLYRETNRPDLQRACKACRALLRRERYKTRK